MSYEGYAECYCECYFKSLRKPPSDESRNKVTPHVSPQNAMLVFPSATGHGVSLKAYREVDMSLKVKGIRCTGRADYAIGYGTSGNKLETFFVITKAESLGMEKVVAQTLFHLGKPLMCSLGFTSRASFLI